MMDLRLSVGRFIPLILRRAYYPTIQACCFIYYADRVRHRRALDGRPIRQDRRTRSPGRGNDD